MLYQPELVYHSVIVNIVKCHIECPFNIFVANPNNYHCGGEKYSFSVDVLCLFFTPCRYFSSFRVRLPLRKYFTRKHCTYTRDDRLFCTKGDRRRSFFLCTVCMATLRSTNELVFFLLVSTSCDFLLRIFFFQSWFSSAKASVYLFLKAWPGMRADLCNIRCRAGTLIYFFLPPGAIKGDTYVVFIMCLFFPVLSAIDQGVGEGERGHVPPTPSRPPLSPPGYHWSYRKQTLITRQDQMV